MNEKINKNLCILALSLLGIAFIAAGEDVEEHRDTNPKVASDNAIVPISTKEILAIVKALPTKTENEYASDLKEAEEEKSTKKWKENPIFRIFSSTKSNFIESIFNYLDSSYWIKSYNTLSKDVNKFLQILSDVIADKTPDINSLIATYGLKQDINFTPDIAKKMAEDLLALAVTGKDTEGESEYCNFLTLYNKNKKLYDERDKLSSFFKDNSASALALTLLTMKQKNPSHFQGLMAVILLDLMLNEKKHADNTHLAEILADKSSDLVRPVLESVKMFKAIHKKGIKKVQNEEVNAILSVAGYDLNNPGSEKNQKIVGKFIESNFKRPREQEKLLRSLCQVLLNNTSNPGGKKLKKLEIGDKIKVLKFLQSKKRFYDLDVSISLPDISYEEYKDDYLDFLGSHDQNPVFIALSDELSEAAVRYLSKEVLGMELNPKVRLENLDIEKYVEDYEQISLANKKGEIETFFEKIVKIPVNVDLKIVLKDQDIILKDQDIIDAKKLDQGFLKKLLQAALKKDPVAVEYIKGSYAVQLKIRQMLYNATKIETHNLTKEETTDNNKSLKDLLKGKYNLKNLSVEENVKMIEDFVERNIITIEFYKKQLAQSFFAAVADNRSSPNASQKLKKIEKELLAQTVQALLDKGKRLKDVNILDKQREKAISKYVKQLSTYESLNSIDSTTFLDLKYQKYDYLDENSNNILKLLLLTFLEPEFRPAAAKYCAKLLSYPEFKANDDILKSFDIGKYLQRVNNSIDLKSKEVKDFIQGPLDHIYINSKVWLSDHQKRELRVKKLSDQTIKKLIKACVDGDPLAIEYAKNKLVKHQIVELRNKATKYGIFSLPSSDLAPAPTSVQEVFTQLSPKFSDFLEKHTEFEELIKEFSSDLQKTLENEEFKNKFLGVLKKGIQDPKVIDEALDVVIDILKGAKDKISGSPFTQKIEALMDKIKALKKIDRSVLLNSISNLKESIFKKDQKGCESALKSILESLKLFEKPVKDLFKYAISEAKKVPDTFDQINPKDVNDIFELLMLFIGLADENRGLFDIFNRVRNFPLIGSALNPGNLISLIQNSNTTLGWGFLKLYDTSSLFSTFGSIIFYPLHIAFYLPKLIGTRIALGFMPKLLGGDIYKAYETIVKQFKEDILTKIETQVDNFELKNFKIEDLEKILSSLSQEKQTNEEADEEA